MRKMMIGLMLAALSTPALAQEGQPKEPRDKGVYITLEAMKAIADGVVDAATGKPKAFSKRLISHSTHSTAFIRMTKPEGPHAHGTWSELFVVITGITGYDSATHKDLFLDPQKPATSAPPRKSAPGDLAGTDVEGGYRQHVKVGDIILIPAGVSHRWVEVDGAVTYLDIKFPKAD